MSKEVTACGSRTIKRKSQIMNKSYAVLYSFMLIKHLGLLLVITQEVLIEIAT